MIITVRIVKDRNEKECFCMVKIYVVDTNVLIQAPYGMQCFEDNQVVLPVVVLEELDNLKKRKERLAQMSGQRSGCWRNCGCREICWKE